MADKNMGPPPAYNPGQYPPPAQGAYPPPQQGYPGYPPPPQGGYGPPPPQQGYGPPPPQGGYGPQQGYGPPPPQGYGYGPAPAMQQSSTNVVVVGQTAPTQTVVVQRQGVNHVLHCIITFFFWPWVIVWIILCITEGS